MRSTTYHAEGSPLWLLGLEIVERAAGGALLYFLPSLLEQSQRGHAEAVRITGYLSASIYALSVIVRIGRFQHATGLRAGAMLMLGGVVLFLSAQPFAILAGGLAFALGAALWKTSVLPSIIALGGRTGILHAAVAAGHVLGVPLFGWLGNPLRMVMAVAAALAVLCIGTAFVPIGESSGESARRGPSFPKALGLCVALVPLSMLVNYPLLSFAAQAVRLADAHGLNAGTFGTVLLVASMATGLIVRSTARSLVSVALLFCLVGIYLLERTSGWVPAVLAAHALFGLGDGLLHQFLYPAVLTSRTGTTAFFVSIALGQAALAATAAVPSSTLLAILAPLAIVGAAAAYWLREAVR